MRTRAGTVYAVLAALLVAGGALELAACSSAGAHSLSATTTASTPMTINPGGPMIPATSGPRTTPTLAAAIPSATLSCVFYALPQPGMGSFRGGISCQVSGASSAETGFTVTFSTNEAVCRGRLTQGSGSCEVSFSISQPFSVGTVAGELLPSHRPLGPVHPALAP